MQPVAIRIENLGKQYRLGRRQRYKALRDTFADAAAAPFRALRAVVSGRPGSRGESATTFWALRDVSLEVHRGEIVGLIGRNGAGKSTLLKVLSRITEPTTGAVDVYGRVGSLLEVGTGFHPELTGRENIFLNGAILGMSSADIRARFDEIVSFAEVEQFLDTPVKHYSSGMYMRLAFAVAAHMETEILLVDEVLAVGDASFQRKCLNKMEDVGKQGRTVFFVSHNMPAITRLCSRAILLDQGLVIHDGASHEVAGVYLRSGTGSSAFREWPDIRRAPGNEVTRLRSVRVRGEEGLTTATLDIRRPVGVEMEYDVLQPGHVLVPGFHFRNDEGALLFASNNQEGTWRRRPRPAGCFRSVVWIPGNFLSEGTVIVDAAISTLDPLILHALERECVAFQVIDSTDGDSVRGDYAGPYPGAVRPLLLWGTETIAASTTDSVAERVQTVP